LSVKDKRSGPKLSRNHFHRRHAQCEAFWKRLESGDRPDTIDEAYALVSPGVCGLFETEAVGLWGALMDQQIFSLVEVGRNLGGGLVFLCCACPDVKLVRSIDLVAIPECDEPVAAWMRKQGIRYSLEEMDSSEASAFGMVYDFVWIDGGHTGECVAHDIAIWKDHARLLGFHDFADKKHNAHKRCFQDVVDVIAAAEEQYGWQRIGKRGRSEIVFRTGIE